MTDEKTVELTEAEKDMLDAAYDSDFLGLVEVVESIVTAREIAAEQAGREDNALHEMCYVSGSKALEAREAAARREALLEAADAYSDFEVYLDTDGHRSMCKHGLTTPEWLRKHAAALAEPERDEEGGR